MGKTPDKRTSLQYNISNATKDIMPALPEQKVAFVTGANGISGYAIIEHLVRQPKEEWYVYFMNSNS
jgi:hypothetical protein